MKNIILSCIMLIAMAFSITSARKTTTIFMIGDSTMANKDISKGSPERGWGMVLQGFFTDDIVVDNHAVNGRSSKSFIDEGRWQVVVDRIKPGDYVFIQFGHNDEKPAVDRHTDPGTTFDANLERFVNETRAKGGIPVIFNAVERRSFFDKKSGAEGRNIDDESLRDTKFGTEKVNSDTLIPSHGDYVIAPRNVANRLNVPFVDATSLTNKLENSLGVIESRKLHMWLKPGEYSFAPDGRLDNTHYSIYGAHIVSGILVDAIANAVPALKRYVRHYDYIVSDKGRGNYMTLETAIKAIPENNGKTNVLILDGTWQAPKTTKKIKYIVHPTATLKK